MVDRDLALRRLASLEEYRTQLAEYAQVTPDGYAGDWRTQRVVERTLQLAIETCVDLASHVIADRRLRVPASYAETFEILGEAGLLPENLRRTLVEMARFRNILVHDYTRLDPARVVTILRERLGDFDRFRDAILALL